MWLIDDLTSAEEGIASIETPVIFLIVVLLTMTIFEVIGFQKDMSVISYNEQVAVQQLDFTVLQKQPEKLKDQFWRNLNASMDSSFFRSISYDANKLKVVCMNAATFTPLTGKLSASCRLMKITYKVHRRFTSRIFSKTTDLFPVDIDREVFVINDYF
ncbi:hypothetical protein [Dryocola clanedunensis]